MKNSFSTNEIFLNIHYYPSQFFFNYFFWFGRNKILKIFNISENNIISVKLAKVLLGYAPDVKWAPGLLNAVHTKIWKKYGWIQNTFGACESKAQFFECVMEMKKKSSYASFSVHYTPKMWKKSLTQMCLDSNNIV